MENALSATITTLPRQLRRPLNWDRGKEISGHAQFSVETGLSVCFADPHSPWQRGTNENTNGVLRHYFPKGTDPSRWSAEETEAVAPTLHTRPRTTPGWMTPAEALDEHRRSVEQAGVASTPLAPVSTSNGAFRQRLRDAGPLGSIGRVGEALDNSVAESCFAALKTEPLDRHR
jgi:transposase InsO family protein